jgi:hypothetical protein
VVGDASYYASVVSKSGAPATATEAFRRFSEEHSKLLGLVSFLGSLIVRADESRRLASEALRDTARSEEERARLTEELERGDVVLGTMRTHFSQLFTDMVLQRSVDNFLTYVVELVALIYTTRPEALRSAETVKVEEVLEYGTYDELIGFLVERKVDRLAYQSMRDLSGELGQSLNFPLFEGEDALREAERIVEIRNLIVHNRTVVNPKFLRRVPGSRYREGERYKFGADTVFKAMSFLQLSAAEMDGRGADKFGLPREPFDSGLWVASELSPPDEKPEPEAEAKVSEG